MKVFKSKGSAIAERVSDRCSDLESRISETTKAIAIGNDALTRATSVAAHSELRIQIEFSEMQRKNLIAERFALEPERLDKAAADAAIVCGRENTLPGLIARRNELELELTEVIRSMGEAESVLRRLSRAKTSADQALVVLRSRRPIDQPLRLQAERELSDRLESLGK
jgi:hypothetical protein